VKWAREHYCSPAPSERHVNLSVYAAQASPKVPRGTRWALATLLVHLLREPRHQLHCPGYEASRLRGAAVAIPEDLMETGTAP
jgi:hypothetical protein